MCNSQASFNVYAGVTQMARTDLHSPECFGRLVTQPDNRSAIWLALDIEALWREAGLFGERLVRVG